MRTMMRLAVTGLMALLFVTVAQAKPNFSGDWKLNASKSDFGPMPAPTSIVQKITHNEPNIKVASTQVGEQGEIKIDSNYTTDGKECVNKVRDFERKSTLKWDGDTLVIESKVDVQGNAVSITEKWNLSEDGKTLTLSRHISSGQGDFDAKTVLDKQ